MNLSNRDLELVNQAITLLIENGANEVEVVRLKGKLLDLNSVVDSCPECNCNQFSCGHGPTSDCYSLEE